MKEYVMSLLGAALLTGILGTLCPKKHERHMRLLSGLCMVALLIAPLPSYLERAEELLPEWQEEILDNDENKYEEIYHQTILEVNEKQISETTKNRIVQEFSIRSEDVSVSVVLEKEQEEVLLKKASVSIGGSAITMDPREIRACVENFLNCPCEIVYR